MNESNGVIRDARKLGIPKMLILGLQHMFAMFGATILVPILVNSYFVDACGEGPSRGLTVSVTLFCAGFGTLLFHLCAKFKVPAFLGSSFAFLSGFAAVANLNTGKLCQHECQRQGSLCLRRYCGSRPSVPDFCLDHPHGRRQTRDALPCRRLSQVRLSSALASALLVPPLIMLRRTGSWHWLRWQSSSFSTSGEKECSKSFRF